MSRATAPHVYRAIAAITRGFSTAGIAKAQRNEVSGFAFRGIDDIYNALSPLLAKHRLCLLPRILERGSRTHRSTTGELFFAVWVKAAFELRSAVDGSYHQIETYGEALDSGDKGTSKALSAAYKYAIMQAFCIPVAGISEDADGTTAPKLSGSSVVPDEGWSAWVEGITTLVTSCQSQEALDRLQGQYRERLRALSLTEAANLLALGRRDPV